MNIRFLLFVFSYLGVFSLLSFNKADFDKFVQKETLNFMKKSNVSGLAIGVIKASYDMKDPFSKVYTFGNAQKFPEITIKESTVFRLGSTSQLFLGLLLAKSIEEGKIKLEDKASQYLSKSFKLPDFHGEEIKIKDLAFHTSSLPNEPTTILRRYQASSYEIKNYLKTYKLPKKPGSRFEKSDLGYSILAQCLEHTYRESIDKLLSEGIFEELGMSMTSLKELKAHYNKLAVGYRGVKVASQEKVDKGYSFFAPATAVLTTPKDLQIFMESLLHLKENKFSKIVKTFYNYSRQVPDDNLSKRAFGTKLCKLSPSNALQTYKVSSAYHGFSSALAFIPDTKTSVFILGNTEESVAKLADKLLVYLNE